MLPVFSYLIKRFINFKNPSDLEKFILSKHPTSTADIEYWAKIYTQRQGNNHA